MKLLCLGAGGMGALAAKTAASFQSMERIIVADLNLDSASHVAFSCSGKAESRSINVSDTTSLVNLMKEADVVMNSIGPFFRFGVPVLKAAIQAGTNYFDICDDPEPTLEMLRLNDDAKKAGITAVIGIGASPGITNMLAARVHGTLDEMTELHTAWNIQREDEEEPTDILTFSAAIVHWMQQISGTILECRDGALGSFKPLEPAEINYPGLGRRTLWTVGHPEPVSLAWSYPELRRSSCLMVMNRWEADLFKNISKKIDSGGFSLEKAGRYFIDYVNDLPFLEKMKFNIADLLDRPALPMFFVIGKGKRNGKPATAAASLRSMPSGMAKATGIPMAIAVDMFARERISRKGVMPPELAMDPDEFFTALAPWCTSPSKIPPEKLVDMVVR